MKAGRSRSSSDFFCYKESVDGRVMLDQGAFAKMNPELSMDTAEPSRGWLQGTVPKTIRKARIDEFDPMLKYAPAIAYGFSFSVRKWGCFTIDGISMIQFISSAFDTLVMNEDIKNTLLTLTEHYIKQARGSQAAALTNADPLPNKGKGCIVLLHGPPGTGKTLTVESLAEKLECPLWQLSVPTISERKEELETNLLRTFAIAASWRAILVLDEADVYLASRKYSPLSSNVHGTNAMTGIFLRVLEYYTGILFLTTNMIESMEPAIYSRMSLFVKYEEFSMENRKQLWVNCLNRIGFQNPSQEFWEHVLPKKFNGRIIRNIIQNAQVLAQSKGASVSEEHLLTAFDVMATPSTMNHLIQSEDKPDPKQASTTISTHAPSVVTDSTLSHLREEEEE
jgi:SpoVK/Ycf46/Vps4 family AAA+-type ATPase